MKFVTPGASLDGKSRLKKMIEMKARGNKTTKILCYKGNT